MTGAAWRDGSTRSTRGSRRQRTCGAPADRRRPSARPRPVRSSSRPALDRAPYEAGVDAGSASASPRGDIYQANLTRRLETPFDGDPWDLYRRLRTGDPSLFSAYLDLGPEPADRRGRGRSSRPRPSRSSSVDADGVVTTDPIKGTRPRGRDARRRTVRSRASCSSSAKDRAENVMIVDVLRNDLGRVCRPGHRSASRGSAGSSGRPPSSTSSRP